MRLNLVRGKAVCLRCLWGSLDDCERIPWAATLVFVVAPVCVLALSNGRTQGSLDTRPVVPTALSLILRGSLELSPFLGAEGGRTRLDPGGKLPYCLTTRGKRVYSAYPLGMVVWALPFAAAARCTGSDLDDPNVWNRIEKRSAVLVESLCTALFFLVTLRIAQRRRRPYLETENRSPASVKLTAFTATWLCALASGMFSTTAQALWQHGGVILGTLFLLWIEFEQNDDPVSHRGVVLQGLTCGWMLACRLSAVTFLFPFFVWIALSSRTRAFRLVTATSAGYLPWAWIYWKTYGSPLGPSSGFLQRSWWSTDIWSPLAGLLISPGRGFFVYQPWALLTIGIVLTRVRVRAGGPRGWIAFCLAAASIHLGLIMCWRIWWGGYAWGSRLLVELIPLCGLLCVPTIELLGSRRTGRVLIAALGIAGVAMQIPGVYFDAARWNIAVNVDVQSASLWSWRNPPFLYPFNSTLARKQGTTPPIKQTSRRAHFEKSPDVLIR